jgi:hypothetical protein
MDDVPEAQRLTYIRVFQACGELWEKEILEEALPDLILRVIEAICLVELHLPAIEADIKLHNLMHLAFSIGDWGKSHQHFLSIIIQSTTNPNFYRSPLYPRFDVPI